MQNLPQELQSVLSEIAKQHVDASKKNRLDSFRKLNLFASKNGVVFVGDSITEGFPLYEMYQGNKPIYNRGIGGFTSMELLQNLQVLVYDLKPSEVVLLIGTNDLGVGQNPEEIVQRIEQICCNIKEKLPDVRILIQSVYPINNSDHNKAVSIFGDTHGNEDIRRLNTIIFEWASRSCIEYIDLYTKLSDREGNLRVEFTTDGIHLSIDGYLAVYDELKNHL
jgi:lysophospholipase L1-like esterase